MTTQTKRIIILVEDLFNIFEFWYPYYRLQEAGMEVTVVGPEKGKFYTGKPATEIQADIDAASVRVEDYHGLLIPGGYAPDRMRRYPAMVDIVRNMNMDQKPVAAICHAGWMLISADILKGRSVTSYVAIKDDMLNAGAVWKDRPVVVDKNLITSRKPEDLPVFMKTFLMMFEKERPPAASF
ncbi:MAG: type 1 glutamine amidotransferase [Proteobacteria bacterium]|nr:type 1 glutamine amidotransferase [Pseudomonadota bacterium]